MIEPAVIFAARILVVDDLEANVLLLVRMLRLAGYTAVSATSDSREVCELHRTNAYDLILLDLQMPGMDGFQVMEGLQRINPNDYLPVLVITAQPGHKLRALQAGAKDFISKPYELSEVLARVRNMLEVRLLHKALQATNDALEQRIRESSAASADRARVARYNQSVLDSTGEGLFGVDRDGAFTFLNAAAGRLLGLDPEAVRGQSAHALIHWRHADGSPLAESEDRIALAARHGQASTDVAGEVFVRGDGTSVPVEYTASPLQDDAGDGGAVVAFSDVTQRLQVEQLLLAAKSDAELANVAKSQFLANMSHELRTPLNAVILYSELLKDDAEAVGRVDLANDLEKIRAAGRHLLALVNGVLDLSKVEAGKMEFFIETFDVATMAHEVAQTVMPACRKSRIELITELGPDVGSMNGDVIKVRQILINLLSNASKFTSRGTVTLSVARRAERPGTRPEIDFRVSDTGLGMSPAAVERLFQPFMQADASTTRRFGGTGLGLAISKRFAELLEGRISVESAPGQGSTFTLTLPVDLAWSAAAPRALPAAESVPAAPGAPDALVAPVPTDPLMAMLAPGSAGGAVLIIDDDPIARDVMMRMLTSQGVPAIAAADGEEGLRLARELAPCMVLLDVMMPRVDGWAVLTAMKADPLLANIPVVMITFVNERELGFMLGAADYLNKPVERQQISELLTRFRPATSDTTVLLVEDDELKREALGRVLTQQVWTVVKAADGREALALLAEHRARRR